MSVRVCIIRASPPPNEITAQTRPHGSFSQSLPLHFPVAAKRRPQVAGGGEQRRIENLQVGRLFIFLPEADVSLCNFIQLRSVYLSHRVNTDVERRRRGEMNSPVPQRAPCYCVAGRNVKKKKPRNTRVRFPLRFFLLARSPRLPLAHFDVRKVEGNQSHFLLSGRCGLLLPAVRLAVKLGRSGKCVQRRNAAKHNTGKPPVRGGRGRRSELPPSPPTSGGRPFAGVASHCIAPCRHWGKFPSERQRATF